MSRQLYLNRIQADIRHAILVDRFKEIMAICGRGTGKSTILGDYLYSCIDTMPRSRGPLVSNTEETIVNRSLSAIQEHWERMGLIEGRNEDYVIGLKPPSDWDTPYSKPKEYKNIITFWNGGTIDMVSLYKSASGRGASYQFLAGDEMGLVKRENFAPNIIPTMRGCLHKVARIEIEEDMEVPFGEVVQVGVRYFWEIPFRDNPYYMSTLLVSSMPYLDAGKWILDYENNPKAFYIEGTALDNIDVLGVDYVPKMQAILHDLEFQVEIMNKRITQCEDGFYNRFSDEKHVIDTNPYKADMPIDISIDFGKFMGMVVGQYYDEKAWVVDVLYVKNGDIKALMKLFMDKYAQHQVKECTIYGDASGNYSRTSEDDKRVLYEVVEEELSKAGWRYYRPFKTVNPPHADKYLVINDGLTEQASSTLPPVRIYAVAAKALILSMKLAPMNDKLGKDKSSEHPKSSTPEEEATHLSDAFDYWYYDRFHAQFSFSNSGSGMGVYVG